MSQTVETVSEPSPTKNLGESSDTQALHAHFCPNFQPIYQKHPTPGDVLVLIGIAALMGLALREQLQLPKDQRAWHGTLFNIPYDFRWPTKERLREAF